MTVWLDLLQLADGRKLVPTLRPVPAPGAQFVSLLPGTFAAFRPKAPVKPAPWPEGEMPEHELIVATLPTTREQGAQLVDTLFERAIARGWGDQYHPVISRLFDAANDQQG